MIPASTVLWLVALILGGMLGAVLVVGVVVYMAATHTMGSPAKAVKKALSRKKKVEDDPVEAGLPETPMDPASFGDDEDLYQLNMDGHLPVWDEDPGGGFAKIQAEMEARIAEDDKQIGEGRFKQ